ncbi:YrdB family protein [Streptomyces sp. NPDC057496]|uniref:YrdB family protein n=1 Tax=Streptomyces sp. NPDC057496 TaxID=3346149 RepID=UPI0036B105CD
MTSEGHGSPAAPASPPWFMANELLAFLVELAALVMLSWWGFTAGDGTTVHLLLGIGAPAAAAAVWGLFAAPRARFPLPLVGVLLVKAVVLGAGVYAVHAMGHSMAAVLFGIVVAANTAAAETFRHRMPDHGPGRGTDHGPGRGPGRGTDHGPDREPDRGRPDRD